MSQETVFGEVEVNAFIELKRKNGSTEYFMVCNGENLTLTKEEYDYYITSKPIPFDGAN